MSLTGMRAAALPLQSALLLAGALGVPHQSRAVEGPGPVMAELSAYMASAPTWQQLPRRRYRMR